mgnify:CR=1 FL=1
MDRIKRCNDELKAERPTIQEIDFIPRLPIFVLIENIRSVHNVGSIFRSADGFGAEKIYLTGYTAHPPREDLHKTALGAEKTVPWAHFDSSLDALKDLKKNNITPVVIEQTIKSISIYDFGFEDVYIEEFKKDATLYWRVRTGNFNSMIKAEKHEKKLSEVLEINIDKIWALEIK